MSKTKNSAVPHYELLILVSNEYTEDEVKPIVEKAAQTIEGNGGKITLKEDWGKRRLAYPIKHFNHGYYFLFEFDIDGIKMSEIDRSLRMNSMIMRHQIVSKKTKTEEQLQKQIKNNEKREAKEEARKKLENEKEKGRVDLKDLDEKLDKILETDDLL